MPDLLCHNDMPILHGKKDTMTSEWTTFLTRKIITVISTGRWLGLICSHRGDEFPATALHHLGRLDGGVPPGGSVRHHLTIGQQAAVTAFTDLLSQPERVRPGAIIFTDSVGTGAGLRH